MSSPLPGAPQPGEQIAYQDILNSYQDKVSELTHQLVLAQCLIKNRDQQIEGLLAELDKK